MVVRNESSARSASDDDAMGRLATLRDRIGQLQRAQIAYGRRAIILLEGLPGSAKKFVLRQLASSFDPCHFSVHPILFDQREAEEGHWLARFWRQLPAAGNTALFFHSWYRRVLDDRVLSRASVDGALRALDEINEFEVQQRDYGTSLVKLFFDVSADVQEQRLADRRQDPWQAQDAAGDFIHADDPTYQQALSDLRANTDTRWSPWRTIDADDQEQAAIAALQAVEDVWRKAMPSEPPSRRPHSG